METDRLKIAPAKTEKLKGNFTLKRHHKKKKRKKKNTAGFLSRPHQRCTASKSRGASSAKQAGS